VCVCNERTWGRGQRDLLMKKNNVLVKASQERVKHSHWGLMSVKARGRRSTLRPRADLDLHCAERSGR